MERDVVYGTVVVSSVAGWWHALTFCDGRLGRNLNGDFLESVHVFDFVDDGNENIQSCTGRVSMWTRMSNSDPL
jgi:hypothetical protein